MAAKRRSGGMGRTTAVVGVALLLIALGAGNAVGIVYGEPDGNDHPFVGSLVAAVPIEGDTILFQFCTGTLLDGALDREVFLTAAHCVFDLDTFLPAGTDMYVTFDSTIAESLGDGEFYGPLEYDSAQQSGDIFWNQAFGTHGMSDLYDVAVVLLDEAEGLPDSDATLPPAGFLDGLKKSGELKHARFTTVGYGAVRDSKQGAFAAIGPNLDRRRAEQGFMSLTGAWLSLPMNPRSVDNGGTCYGDSGGPHFYEDTSIVASITVTGDAPCKAADKTYRMDTASARDFLGAFVDLP